MPKSNKQDLVGQEVYLPSSDGEQIKIEVSDSEVVSSGRDLELVLTHQKLHGLDVPKRKQGTLSPIDKERWLVVIETLMQRGVKSIRELTDITGLGTNRAGEFVREVRERWASSLTMGQVNSRREQIYLEAERVKDECWRALQLTDNESMRLAYLKMIIDCGKRQSALIGAERINVNVESKTIAAHKTAEEMEAEVAKNLSISVEQFSAIGEMLSKQLTLHRKDTPDD